MAYQSQTLREALVLDIMDVRLDNLPEGYNSVLQEALHFIEEEAKTLETTLKADPAMSPEDRTRFVGDAAAAVDDHLRQHANALDAAGVDVMVSALNGSSPQQGTDSFSLLAQCNPDIIEVVADAVSAGNPHQDRDEKDEVTSPNGHRYFSGHGADVSRERIAHAGSDSLCTTFKSASKYDDEEKASKDAAFQAMMAMTPLEARIEYLELKIKDIEEEIAKNDKRIAEIDEELEMDAKNRAVLEVESDILERERRSLGETLAEDGKELDRLGERTNELKADQEAVQIELDDKKVLLDQTTAVREVAWEEVSTVEAARNETFNEILSSKGIDGSDYSMSQNAAGEWTVTAYSGGGGDEIYDVDPGQSYTFDELGVSKKQWEEMKAAQGGVDTAYKSLNETYNAVNTYTLKEDIGKLETQVGELGEQISNLEEREKALAEKIAMNEKRLEELDGKDKALEEKFEGLLTEEQIKARAQESADLVAKNEELGKDLSLLYEELEPLKKQYAAQMEEISVLDAQLKASDAQLAALEEQLDKTNILVAAAAEALEAGDAVAAETAAEQAEQTVEVAIEEAKAVQVKITAAIDVEGNTPKEQQALERLLVKVNRFLDRAAETDKAAEITGEVAGDVTSRNTSYAAMVFGKDSWADSASNSITSVFTDAADPNPTAQELETVQEQIVKMNQTADETQRVAVTSPAAPSA